MSTDKAMELPKLRDSSTPKGGRGSGRDLAKLRDTLNRVRTSSKKSGADFSQTSGDQSSLGAGDASSKSKTSVSASADRRKILQRMRTQGKSAKDDVNGDDEANLASSGAGKSVFFDEDFVSVVGDKEDEDYDPYSMEQEFSPLQDDQFVDILETSFAEDFFPMSFLQKSRGTENRLLGVVHLPPRRPLFFRKFSCKYTAVLPTDCCQPTQSCYFDCCNCHPEYNMHLKSEQEFLDGSRSLEFVDWLENRSVISNQLADIENQQAMISQPLGVQTADHLIDNGVFDIRAPTMARILLRGEPIAGNIASITAPDLDLARVTQRLLQEAKVALVRDEVRRKWFQSGNSKLGTQEVPPSAKLLKYLGTAPMLNIIENPADDSEKQILLPTTTVQYGGKLGDWSADASEEERFGAIPPSFENKKSGKALFRVHVHKLVLSQHHLMSEEERGVLQLKLIYSNYRSLFEQRPIEYLLYRLDALVSQSIKCVGSHKNEMDEEQIEDLVEYLKMSYNDLLETVQALREVVNTMDDLSKSLYSQWGLIKDARKRQGYQTTNALLTSKHLVSNIRKGSTSFDPKKSRRKVVSTATTETEDSSNPWKRLCQDLHTVPTLLQDMQGIIFRDIINESNEPSVGSSDARYALSQAEKRRELREKLDKTVEMMKVIVKELIDSGGLLPHFIFRLSDEGFITPDNQLSSAEYRRKLLLSRLAMKVSIRLDGKLISSTGFYPLSSTFTVNFRSAFEFRLLHQPQNLMIEVHMGKLEVLEYKDVLVSTVAIPFPGQSIDSRPIPTQAFLPLSNWYSFSSIPGAPANSYSLACDGIMGSILCTTEFDFVSSDHAPVSTKTLIENGLSLGDAALLPFNRVHGQSKLAQKSRINDFSRENDFQLMLPEFHDLDVNDPRNDSLLVTKAKRAMLNDDRDYFYLKGLDFSVVFGMGEHGFTNFVKFCQPSRMKLLRLRIAKPFLFSGPIPLSEDVIRQSEIYKKLLGKDAIDVGLEDEDDLDTALGGTGKESVNLMKVTSYLQRVRNSHTANNRKAKKKKLVTSSVVIETDYLALGTIKVPSIFERRRSLHPFKQIRAPVAMQVDKCEILLQIVGAKNIPLRKEYKKLNPSTRTKLSARMQQLENQNRAQVRELSLDVEAGGFGEFPSTSANEGSSRRPIVSEHILDERKINEKRRARTFVEVRFQERRVATSSYEGATPLWKESISLPFRPPDNDFSPSVLEQMREDVYLTLFDEIIEDDADRGGFLDGENTVRVEKKYLASFTIPFATVYQQGRIEGLFRMDTPMLNFGYDHESSAVMRQKILQEQNMFVGDDDSDEQPLLNGPAGSSRRNSSSRRLGRSRRSSAGSITPAVLDDYFGPLQGIMDGIGEFCYGTLEWIYKLTHSQPWQPNSRDLFFASEMNLHNANTYIHPDTQNELQYYACGDSSTYLKILITLDPVLAISPVIDDDISTSTVTREDVPYVNYAREWIKRLHDLGPHTKTRVYKAFAVNSSGDNVLICRFLTPQCPPRGFQSRRACLHLLSMMPFMRDSQSFIGEADLWCTTKEFWEIGAGDEEEHGVLLYNYLSYLQMTEAEEGAISVHDFMSITSTRNMRFRTSSNASLPSLAPSVGGKAKQLVVSGYPTDEAIEADVVFMVLGRAIPEGNTTYVLVRDVRQPFSTKHSPEGYLLINPCNGHTYSAVDPSCPLQEIYCLVTSYNLWANIQTESTIANTFFDVLNPRNWRPFFGQLMNPHKGGLRTVQEAVQYVDTTSAYAYQVEKIVLQGLRNGLRRWRNDAILHYVRSTTTFHPDASDYAAEMLGRMEKWKRKYGTKTRGQKQRRVGVPTIREGEEENEIAVPDNYEELDDDEDSYRSLADIQEEMKEKMQKILRSRTMKGIPLNMPFTDVDEALAKIRALSIHESKHPEVQFILAVRAFPLYNNLVSLWIFIGTLETESNN